MILDLKENLGNCLETSTTDELNIEYSNYLLGDIDKEKEFNISENYLQSKEIFYNSPHNYDEKNNFPDNEIKTQTVSRERENAFFNDYFFFMDLYNKPVPIKEKIDEISRKSTDDNSLLIKKCIFGINSHKNIEPRIDYAIKYFKVNVIKFIKEYGNILIKLCDFPCYPEGRKNDNRLQRQNKETIKCFKEYIEEKYKEDIPEKYQKLLNYLNMTFQDAIVLFYESKQFKDYSSLSKTIFLDKYFTKAKGFSLLEKNGFFKLVIKKSEYK